MSILTYLEARVHRCEYDCDGVVPVWRSYELIVRSRVELHHPITRTRSLGSKLLATDGESRNEGGNEKEEREEGSRKMHGGPGSRVVVWEPAKGEGRGELDICLGCLRTTSAATPSRSPQQRRARTRPLKL